MKHYQSTVYGRKHLTVIKPAPQFQLPWKEEAAFYTGPRILPDPPMMRSRDMDIRDLATLFSELLNRLRMNA